MKFLNNPLNDILVVTCKKMYISQHVYKWVAVSGKLCSAQAMGSVMFKPVIVSEVLISMCTISVFTPQYIHVIHTVHTLTVHAIISKHTQPSS